MKRWIVYDRETRSSLQAIVPKAKISMESASAEQALETALFGSGSERVLLLPAEGGRGTLLVQVRATEPAEVPAPQGTGFLGLSDA